MKIIIVGAGISGLATYQFLRKHLPNPPSPSAPHSIHIYETYRPRTTTGPLPDEVSFESMSESTAIVGGGLGINPNGMRVLRKLDPSIHAAVSAQGFACEHFVFCGGNGWTLGCVPTSDEGGYEGTAGQAEQCVSSTRHGVWAALMAKVPAGVVQYKKVVEVRTGGAAGGKKVVLVMADGSEEECDLVIGADGVKSVVRKGIFGKDEADGKYTPHYTGLSGIGGIMTHPLPPLVTEKKAMVFTFGGKGFFGYASGGPLSTNSLMWWSTYETPTITSGTNLNIPEIKAALKERHGKWGDPAIREIVSNAVVDTVYPTWVMPDLPHWGENNMILLGDAAHALSPTTGQGTSQGLEDAQTFALLLASLLQEIYEKPAEGADGQDVSLKEREVLPQAAKLFFEIRAPRVKKLADSGRKVNRGKADVGLIMEYFMYAFFWTIMTFPSIAKLIIGDVNKNNYGWNPAEEVRKALAKRGK